MSNRNADGGGNHAPDSLQPMILIVHSHDQMRNALRDWLSVAFSGCRFQEAISGEQALALTLTDPADIVLINLGLPQVSGIEVTRRLKAMSPRTQVVIISFFEEQPYQAAADRAGASAFLTTRSLPGELVPTVANVLTKTVAVNARDEPAL